MENPGCALVVEALRVWCDIMAALVPAGGRKTCYTAAETGWTEPRDMLFNSIAFLFFLPIVFGGYWLILCPNPRAARGGVSHRRLGLQNLLIVAASYLFYGWWDWRFLLLMTFTSVWAFGSGCALRRVAYRGVAAKWILGMALVVNLGILGVFKYCNFFVEQAVALLNAFGFQAHPTSLRIILPVGISFYTFQALGYVIDVYRNDLKPTRNVVAFLAFVSFFPQLVAGPIERATNLLPQFQRPRYFSCPMAVDGCRQMLWGFFKKIAVADNCALVANAVFSDAVAPGGMAVLLGALAFSFQIYGDFSGYSDIAIGCSKLFGIRLMRNFNQPYFSRDIAEFWRRWHISLTTWFRDYLYIPLDGSRCGTWRRVRNTFVTFMVSGLWHGANWTFVAWGVFHALCFLPLLLTGRNRRHGCDAAAGRVFPTVGELWRMGGTFALVVVGWLLFRAPDIGTFGGWLGALLCNPLDGTGVPRDIGMRATAAMAAVTVVAEWMTRGREHPLAVLPCCRAVRWGIYWAVLAVLFLFSARSGAAFVYFRF